MTKAQIRDIIFESDTRPGKLFDLVLLWAILLSVLVVMLDSVRSFQLQFGTALYYIEWTLTVIFTIEYVLRIWTIGKPVRYIFSFYGLIDLLSILPTYVSLVVAGSHYLLVIRTLRLLRVFRILKLVSFVKEARMLMEALKASRYKLTVFLGTVVSITVIIGTAMYLIEGPENGFTSIPTSIYWTIVTMTTVGYGDISPHTVLGQTLASVVMLLGYTIIAVPTGIVSMNLLNPSEPGLGQACPNCSKEGHDLDAIYCKYCSARLN